MSVRMATNEEQETEETESFCSPNGVKSDDQDEDIVVVSVVFLGLKKKLMRNEPSNATLDLKFATRTIDLRLSMKDKGGKKYRYNVKKLVDDIEPEKCYHKVKENKVVIYLKKAKSRLWANDLSDYGLDIYREPDEDE